MTELEFSILNSIQGLRCEPLDALMIIASLLGSIALPWIISALVLLLRKGERRYGAVISLGMLLGLFFGSLIIKHIVMRERPFNNENGLLTAANLPIPVPSDRYSFPSAHSVTSFAAATGIYFRDRRFGFAAYVLATLIAFSRVYLYVHFPTDVLAGALLGIVCAFAARRIVNSFLKKQRK